MSRITTQTRATAALVSWPSRPTRIAGATALYSAPGIQRRASDMSTPSMSLASRPGVLASSPTEVSAPFSRRLAAGQESSDLRVDRTSVARSYSFTRDPKGFGFDQNLSGSSMNVVAPLLYCTGFGAVRSSSQDMIAFLQELAQNTATNRFETRTGSPKEKR